MNIQTIGLNHKTAPIVIREKISFSKSTLEKGLTLLRRQPDIFESLILSTCNRVEIYAIGTDAQKTTQSITKFLSTFHGIDRDNFQKYLYTLDDQSAIKHLFRVSSSLDSQVLGENQILAQIKEAYFKAKAVGSVSRIFSFLFEEAIKIGKRARSQTQIGQGAVSISSVAVELAKKIFETLRQKKILIIGAGKIGELSTRYLYHKGADMVLVANRTLNKAKELAKKFNGQALDFSRLPNALAEVDIVISSTSAPHLILTKEDMNKVILHRKQRPIFFIDLGLPRNIDPEIDKIDNIYLFNLDDLKKVKDANLSERLKEAQKVEQIIDNHLSQINIKLKNLLSNENI